MFAGLMLLGMTLMSSAAEFGGNECIGTCVGHAKGYRWAEENEIDDDRCKAVLIRHPNSELFVEGCFTYVEDPDRGYDRDDDGNEIDLYPLRQRYRVPRMREMPHYAVPAPEPKPAPVLIPKVLQPKVLPTHMENPGKPIDWAQKDIAPAPPPRATKPPVLARPVLSPKKVATEPAVQAKTKLVHGQKYYWNDAIPRHRDPTRFDYCASVRTQRPSGCVVVYVNDGKDDLTQSNAIIR